MTVRAKFKCETKGSEEEGNEGNLTLHAVVGGSEENEEFFRYTPFGMIQMGVLNPSAFAQFELGKEYYVDFIPVESIQATESESDDDSGY